MVVLSAATTLDTLEKYDITALGYNAAKGMKGGAPVYNDDGEIEFSLETK